jgi:biopolymer transport protein TolQ
MQGINLIDMFINAGPTVKFVMLLLLSFSVGSWYIIFNKVMLFKDVRKDTTAFLDKFWKSKNLSEAFNWAKKSPLSPEANIFIMGYNELQKLGKKKPGKGNDESFEMRLAGMENLKRAIQKADSVEKQRLARTLNFLATTGSATPFIGLFGTVWGIMSSFHGIGIRGSASLAVVAPGISEALVATAAGLAVAIPAVIFFNHFSSQLNYFESDMERFSTDFLNLVERDLLNKL